MVHRRGEARRGALTKGLLTFALVAAAGACGGGSKDSAVGMSSAALSGRVLSADTGKGSASAAVVGPGGASTKTDASGKFKLEFDGSAKGAVEAKPTSAAPVSKPVPKDNGYVQLYVKDYDGQKEIDVTKGGSVSTPSGARLDIGPKTLRTRDDKATPAKATISIAAPDPNNPKDLSALPGNFDAKQSGGKVGKLSAESPVFVAARTGDKELELTGKAQLDTPVHVKQGQKAMGASLFHYDDATGTWIEAGQALRTTNDDGIEVYRADIEQLGWWSVGTFYDALTCVRGCVKAEAQKPVAFASVTASGVDDFTQFLGYTGEDGCFAIDVRAQGFVSLTVDTPNGTTELGVMQTGNAAATTDKDPSMCRDLGTLSIAGSADCARGECMSDAGTALGDASLSVGDSDASTPAKQDTLSLNGEWLPSEDANQDSPSPTVTLLERSQSAVSISYVGGDGSACGCNAQHLVIPLDKSYDCATATLAFDYQASGTFTQTNNTSVSVRFCNGTCQAVNFYGGNQFQGSSFVGHSNCAYLWQNMFPDPAQLTLGHNEIKLSTLDSKLNGMCQGTFDTIDVHMQAYGCYAQSDTGMSTLSNLQLF